ncbi:MAG: hypothetical protein C4337_08415 [Armatimonadota bacterium]
MRTIGMVLWVAVCAVTWGQESPARWLQRALQAERTLSVAGMHVNTFQIRGRLEQIRERFWRRGDSEIRIEVAEPKSRQGEVFLYREGQWVRWRSGEPIASEVPQMPYMASELLQVVVEWLRRGWLEVTALPDESVAGRACVVVSLKPNRPVPPRSPMRPPNRPPQGRPEGPPARFPVHARLWIERETGLVLKREFTVRPGQTWIRSEVVRIDFAPRLDEALFRLPPGVTVRQLSEQGFRTVKEAQQVAGFPLRLPTYLPPGTWRERILVRRRPPHESPLVAIRYSCPQGHFTLFQTYQPKSRFKPPKHLQQTCLNAHFWEDDGSWFGIVGDLPKEEMEKIARSLSRDR